VNTDRYPAFWLWCVVRSRSGQGLVVEEEASLVADMAGVESRKVCRQVAPSRFERAAVSSLGREWMRVEEEKHQPGLCQAVVDKVCCCVEESRIRTPGRAALDWGLEGEEFLVWRREEQQNQRWAPPGDY
jgi:hypothetical protein